MTKRILSMVLVLALVLSVVPAAVTAEGTQVVQSPKAGTHTHAGHSDDCGLTTGWQEWKDATTLPTAGQYVLMTNVNMSGEVTLTGDLTLCLNGYVVTAKEWARILGTDGTTTLTITDCTAYEENGVYYAGALTGAKYTGTSGGAAIFVRRNGVLKLYDGRITGNLLRNDQTASGGGAIMIQDTYNGAIGTMYMYGGEISDNSYYKSDNATGNNGGAIAVGTAGKLIIEDGRIRNNFGGNGGAIWVRERGELTIKGGTFTGNEGQSGGVVDLVNGAKMTIEGGTFTGNTGNTGGVLHIRANTVSISGATFENNTATFTGSAIYIYSSANLTIGHGTVITGNIGSNTNTTDGWGAAVINGSSSAKVTLTGKVVIANNTIGGKSIGDLNLRQAASDTLYIKDLAEGSFVVFSTPKTQNAAANDVLALGGSQTAAWNNGWLTYKDENADLKHVGFDGTNFSFVDGHFHGNVEYKPLENGDQLISGGSYYLADETVTLTKEAMLNDGVTLNLCLNGHKLTANGHRALSTYGGDKQSVINLDDCTAYYDDQGIYHAGAIDGIKNSATGAGGGAIFIRKNGTLNMYGGIISNNSSLVGGGAMQITGTANIYDGEFYKNQAPGKDGGAIFIIRGGKLNMTGGAFRENSANNGGAILANGSVYLENVTITGNTGKYAAAFGVQDNSAQVTLKNVTITGNNITGEAWGGINIQNDVPVKLEGKVVIQDNLTGSGKQQNLYLCKGVRGVDATALTAGSQIGITLRTDRISAGQMHFSYTTGEKSYFFSDDSAYQVDLNEDNRLYMTEAAPPAPTHLHNGCSDTTCTDHAAIDYKAWTDSTKLPTEGNWYLDTNVTVSASASVSTTLNLCLNGHTVTGYSGSGARMLETPGNGGAVITLADCTAKTENGVYTAGKLTGSTNTHTNSGGGAIFIRAGDTMHLFDGIITANSSATAGGGIFVRGTVHMYGGEISYNKAPGREGGGVYVNSGGVFRMTGGSIKNNEAGLAGAVQIIGTAHLENVTITGNTAKNASAVNVASSGADVTLKDVTVTGNINTSASYGCVNAIGTAKPIKLLGKVVIYDNLTASGKQQNLHLQTNFQGVDASGLGAGSKIGVSLLAGRITAGQMYFTTALASESYFASDDDAYVVGNDGSRLILKPAFTHIHCQCGKTDCTDTSHKQVSYLGWTDSKSMPASGNYCLLTDVSLSAEKSVTGDLNLCLHGHKVVNETDRVISTPANSNITVNVSDCQGSGSITGKNLSVTTGGGAIFVRAGGTVNWYGGSIKNSQSAAGGGAVLVTGTFNLYGGEISGNKAVSADGTAWKDGGAFFLNSGSTTNIYGGKITGNQGAKGSAFYAYRAVLNIYGGEISGNEAHNQGAILMNVDVKSVKISGAPKIVGNTANGKASNLVLSGQQKLQLENVDAAAQVAVTGPVFSPISGQCDDYSESFISDNTSFRVIHKDGALYLGAAGDHKHCLCTGAVAQGCDHTQLQLAAWTDPNTLPTSGNYYLAVDVTVADQVRLTGGELNLCLNGHTVRVAENGNRVFYIRNDAALSITDCAEKTGKITGAKASAIMFDGGNTGAVLNLYRGEFSGNYSTSAGGAIIVQGKGTFNMYGGQITGNISESKVVLDAAGKPVLDETGSQTITTNFGGGGVGGYGADTVFNMYGGEISGNTAIPVTYLNAEGEEATSAGSGGGVYFRGTMNLYGGKICGNTGEQGGGLMLVSANGVLNMYGGEISGNKANRAGGGLITQSGSTFNLYEGLITGNEAGPVGGAGAYISTNTTMNMEGGTISNNYAPNGGAGLYIYRSKVNLADGLITGNMTGKAGNGAGIFVAGEGALLTMTGGTISKNEAYHAGGVLVQSRGEFVFKGGKVTENRANQAGGGIYISSNSKFTMNGGSIVSNWAKYNGGGLSLYRCQAQITGGTISYNTGYIGGVHVIGAKASFSGTTFVGNKAVDKGHGGAMAVGSTSYKQGNAVIDQYSTCTLSGCYFAENTAENGGAIIVMSKGTQFYMYGGTVTGNKVQNGGGGIYLSSNTSATFSGVEVTDNEAKEGGGIFTFRCSSTMENMHIEGNKATGYGGGISLRGLYQGSDTLDIKDSKIIGNTSSGGGGIIVQHYMTMNMDNCLVEENVSSGSAGGVYNLYQSTSHFTNSQFRGNHSGMSGGAVLNTLANWATFDNCIIENNVADKHGGAIYNRCRLEVYNSTIQNNQAAENGGGIGSDGASNELSGNGHGIFLENVKILDNTCGGQGGGIYLHRGCPNRSMKDVTYTGNLSGLEGSAIYSGGDLSMENVEATGNKSENNGYAVYLADSEFDGQGYFTGHKQMSGNMIIKDNSGGDLYMGELTALAITGDGLGEKSHIAVTLHSGLLTQRVFGTYDYEGSDCVYTITCGDRSMTDPEAAPVVAEEEQSKISGDIGLYIGVGIFTVAVILVILILLGKKKKTAAEANKE